MKDESLLARIQVVCPPGAQTSAAPREMAANPTREESCLKLSHRSRALLLRPSQRQLWKKNRFAGALKNTPWSSASKADLLSAPYSKVRNKPARARASLVVFDTPLQQRGLRTGDGFFSLTPFQL